ncbi:MAG: alpha/beta hydrolase [Leptospiraceae bacterium]|nr:alpha/beta hydrolase [Leptospiraceae bacterium]
MNKKLRNNWILFTLMVALVIFSWYLQLAYTPSIVSLFGTNSIAEIVSIDVNGSSQYLVIRGTNIKSQLLLVVHGGPGTPLTPLMRKHNEALEQDFVVVYWEQRGAGKSFTLFMDLQPFSLDQYVEDTKVVTTYLLKRFEQKNIILVGHSWGSLVGITTARLYPELIRVYIGVGQNVHFTRQEKMAYDFTIEKATEANDKQALETLKEIGPPMEGRYSNGKDSILKQRKLLAHYHGDSTQYNIEEAYTKAVIESTEYSWIEKVLFTQGIKASLDAAEKDLKPFNIFQSVPRLAIPAYFISGNNDANASPKLVQEYVQSLESPKKEFILLENSAHYPMLDQPELFHSTLLNIVEKVKN